jgi:hypothetical protein
MIARRKKPPYSTELYRQEGVQFRSVRLSDEGDGSVRLDTQDMGELVEQTWGDEDYEFWVDVPPTEIRKLVLPSYVIDTSAGAAQSTSFVTSARRKQSRTNG